MSVRSVYFSALTIVSATALISLSQCKFMNSDVKSAVGLEAGKTMDVKGAPTFKAISKWFDRFNVSDSGAKSSGNFALSAKTLKGYVTNPAGQGVLKYVDKELERIGEYRTALQSSERYKQEIERLTELESKEIFDIIMVMLYPKEYSPQHGDLFAAFIKEDSINNGNRFLDYYAQDFLTNIGPHSRVATSLEIERKQFAATLAERYLRGTEGKALLKTDLANAEKSLENLKQTLTSKTATKGFEVKGTAAAFLHYYAANQGTRLETAAAPSDSPSKSFLDEEPGPNNNPLPDGGGKQNNDQNGPTPPDGGGSGGQTSIDCSQGLVGIRCPDGAELCAPQGSRCIGPALTSTKSTVSADWHSKTFSSKFSGPKPQSIDCSKLDNSSPQGRIMCERYASYANVTTASSSLKLFGDVGPLDYSDMASTLKEFAGQSSILILQKHELPVQDQGSEGACTAFGATQTLNSLIDMKENGSGFDTPAKGLWGTYQNATMESAYDAILSYTFMSQSGKAVKVSKITRLKTLKELLTALKTQPVWAASEVNSSWKEAVDGGRGSTVVMQCGGKVLGGHAYSFHGFKINKDGTEGHLLLKNSWGNRYGDNGFGKLPISCLASMSTMPLMGYTFEASLQ